MPLSERVSDTLSSILLPATSVYRDLNADDAPLPHSSPSTAQQLHHGEHDEDADEDPFHSSVSPSVLSPASTRPALHPAPPPPPHLTDSLVNNDPPSPFQAEPVQPESLSPTPTSSIYLPARHAQHSPPSSSSVPPPISLSPPSSSVSSRPGHGGAGLGLGASRSAFVGPGGRGSIMGLLGGTRTFDPRGFGSVGENEEDEDEEEENRADLPSPNRDDLRSLAASLPPPPSALSDDATTDTDDDRTDEEEDADAPPDFTSRIPLTSSVGPSSRRRSARPPHGPPSSASSGPRRRGGPTGGILGAAAGMSARERALWRWVNVEDLDGFLQQVYLYYVGKGIWAIGLERVLNLLTVGWVVGFSTFLLGCIDYPRLWHSHHLSEVVIPRCASRLSGFTLLLVLAFASFYAWRVVRFSLGVRRLWEMHEFHTELLEVPEGDIQTIPWHAIVTRLTLLRASHPSSLSSRSSTTAERLDAHDVANRIMREENYLIALFNKDVLDISLPLPPILHRPAALLFGATSDSHEGGGGGRKVRFGKHMLTQTLEWNLSFCLLGFLFGRDGQVRRAFLSERNKGELVEALKRRFILMGIINAVFAPFIVLYLLMYSFFRYFEEYHKNPSSIGSRQFTPLARWKFREFNELPHLFQQRLRLAHPLSDAYINQYPKAKTALLSRFVAFLAGSFAAVLILFSLIDPDAFLHFEITPGRTVLFYIGLTGTVLAVARGMVPDENRVVDPEELMREIIEHTHYLPEEWKDKLHSADVHLAFGKLFQMKVSLFLQELFSVLLTPFVLWYTLPNCAGAVVDFFREFTVHVDGLGYVCSFAVFDFKRHGDAKFGAPVQPEGGEGGRGGRARDERWKSTEGKMEKSFLTFAAHNPAWQPRDATQSLFLSKMTDALPPSSSTYHQHDRLHSSTHLLNPHSRHVSVSTALRPRAGLLQSRFGVGTLAEEELASTPSASLSLGGGATASEQLRAEKARLYNAAFERSTLLASSSSPVSPVGGAGGGARGGSRPNLSHRPSPPLQQQQHGKARLDPPSVIDESSALDGERFVAPTESQPFGLPSDEEDEEESGEAGGGRGGEGSVERMRGMGLKSMVGEMYRR
ncbi:hypothetical protein JCM8547_000782 [Rhodosporidiobolus lusitaniae]